MSQIIGLAKELEVTSMQAYTPINCINQVLMLHSLFQFSSTGFFS